MSLVWRTKLKVGCQTDERDGIEQARAWHGVVPRGFSPRVPRWPQGFATCLPKFYRTLTGKGKTHGYNKVCDNMNVPAVTKKKKN